MKLNEKQVRVLLHVLSDAVHDWGEPFKDFEPEDDFDPYPVAKKLNREFRKMVQE